MSLFSGVELKRFRCRKVMRYTRLIGCRQSIIGNISFIALNWSGNTYTPVRVCMSCELSAIYTCMCRGSAFHRVNRVRERTFQRPSFGGWLTVIDCMPATFHSLLSTAYNALCVRLILNSHLIYFASKVVKFHFIMCTTNRQSNDEYE